MNCLELRMTPKQGKRKEPRAPPSPSHPPPTDAVADQPLTMACFKEVMEQFYQKMNFKMAEMEKGIIKLLMEKLGEVDRKMEKLAVQYKGLRGCVAALITNTEEDLAEMREKNFKIERKLDVVEKKFTNEEKDMLTVQCNLMECALRFRRLPERDGENLIEVFSEALAEVLPLSKEEIADKIDKIYRVNSWIARNKRLPRDVVIYFTSRRIRNEILQATFDDGLSIAAHQLLVLKEIPSKVLKARKEYFFLTEELKKRGIQYRWEIPVGLSFSYMNKRYRLNTIEKAQDFYEEVLVISESIPELEEEEAVELMEEEVSLFEQEVSLSEKDETFVVPEEVQAELAFQAGACEIPETSAAADKRKQQEKRQQLPQRPARIATSKSEVMAEVGPKIRPNCRQMLQELQKLYDGQTC